MLLDKDRNPKVHMVLCLICFLINHIMECNCLFLFLTVGSFVLRWQYDTIIICVRLHKEMDSLLFSGGCQCL